MEASRRAQLELAAAAVAFGAMAFAAKMLAGRIGAAQVVMVRFALGAVPVLLVPSYRRRARRIQRWDLLAYRGLFGGVAVLLFFLAIEHIQVGVAALLNYTAPVFSVAFAALFLGERPRAWVLPPLATAIAGVFLVLEADRGGSAGWAGIGRWELVGVGSAVCSGAALAAIRAARRSEGSWAIYASFTFAALAIATPLGLAHWVWPTAPEWGWLAVVGLLSLFAQLRMTHAFRWVDNARAGVIGQLAVLVAMALGSMLLGERLGTLQLAGSALTLVSVAFVVALGGAPSLAPGTDRRGPAEVP